MTRDDLLSALTHDNVGAWLHLIREGESSNDEAAFTVIYGGQHFTSFDDHPRIFIPLPNGQRSSAAGAFQITATTWGDYIKNFGPQPFTPENQTLCAVWLTARRRALDAVIGGQLHEAIRLCVLEWTSLGTTKLQAQASSIFAAYGGKEAGVPAAPVTSITQEVKPMGVLAAILPALFNAAPDLIRMFGSAGSAMTERNAVVAQKVADVAKQVTGAVNEQEAAERITNDPQAAEAFRQAVAQNFDQWVGMMVKFTEMDEASKAKAREFVSADHQTVLFGFTFPQVLALFMAMVCAAGGGFVLWDPQDKFTTDMQTAVVMLMLVGGWTGIKEFFFGGTSSIGKLPPSPK
jgi:muramidase (phage lysozyme)